MAQLNERVGNNIKFYRTKNALSQEQMENATGIARQTISRIEIGKQNVTLDQLEKFAEAMSIDISNLFETNDANAIESLSASAKVYSKNKSANKSPMEIFIKLNVEDENLIRLIGKALQDQAIITP